MFIKLITFSLYFSFIFLFYGVQYCLAFSEDAKKLATEAFNAEENGDIERGDTLFLKLLNFDINDFEEDKREIAKDRIFSIVYKKVNLMAKNGNTIGAISWIDKGLALGPAYYQGSINIYYPALLTLKGLGLYELKKYDQSLRYLQIAKEYNQKTGDSSDIMQFKKAIDEQIQKGVDANRYQIKEANKKSHLATIENERELLESISAFDKSNNNSILSERETKNEKEKGRNNIASSKKYNKQGCFSLLKIYNYSRVDEYSIRCRNGRNTIIYYLKKKNSGLEWDTGGLTSHLYESFQKAATAKCDCR